MGECASPERASTASTAIHDIDMAIAPDCEGYTSYPRTPHPITRAVSTHASRCTRFVAKHPHIRECLAEFFGTFIMLCYGMGVNNMVLLSEELKPHGSWISINLCWGFGVMVAVHCTEGVSGSHLNPLVTVAHTCYRGFPVKKIPGYIISQVCGAYCGAFVIYMLYSQTIDAVDPERTLVSAGHFAPLPMDMVSWGKAFYTEFFASAMLVIGIYSITDKQNRPASPHGAPLSFGLLIAAIGMAFGMNTGYTMNPARDFGPRLFTCMAGWGIKVFTARDYYFINNLIAPILGGIVGGGAYKLFIQNHHPSDGLLS